MPCRATPARCEEAAVARICGIATASATLHGAGVSRQPVPGLGKSIDTSPHSVRVKRSDGKHQRGRSMSLSVCSLEVRLPAINHQPNVYAARNATSPWA
ncbi:hypothetical protein P171DRAFT_182719 [Karstenula rhodostoma CBS 690.94]|uniref:Uncharacterized protein n=1 Tax=Karstenula rhodostoma CBS 690.94 TaxID=1392251 RepID=A0A9P4P5W1_9PLEO|nr:hypothetical protein P171DRAFT_182719 [Karstenula rhodostoma CBS 690.94]